jgi:hypothetical protein
VNWKILILLGIQLPFDLLNCYLAAAREIKGRGASPLSIVPIIFTALLVISFKFHNPDAISFGELIMVIFLSIVVHFGLSLLIPGLIGRVIAGRKS